MASSSVEIEIQRPVHEVFAAISDVTRMGEWSPECTGGEWTNGASGPEVGAQFLGHNKVPLHKWTTNSEVTECVANEAYDYPPVWGVRGFVYDRVLRREKTMQKGMATTLAAVKKILEG